MPEVSRRALVATGAGVAGLVVLDQMSATAQTRVGVDALSGPLRSHFAGAEGEVFTLVGRHGRARARLRSIVDVAAARGADRELCFVLVFTPLDGRTLGEASWSVRRRGVPTHDLFLSALGRHGEVQAVIDRRTA